MSRERPSLAECLCIYAALLTNRNIMRYEAMEEHSGAERSRWLLTLWYLRRGPALVSAASMYKAKSYRVLYYC